MLTIYSGLNFEGVLFSDQNSLQRKYKSRDRQRQALLDRWSLIMICTFETDACVSIMSFEAQEMVFGSDLRWLPENKLKSNFQDFTSIISIFSKTFEGKMVWFCKRYKIMRTRNTYLTMYG